jgi:uncharacterized protein
VTKDDLIAIISVTKNCNFRCSYCYVQEKNYNVISFETLKKIINGLLAYNKHKVTEIIWHGGEPLLAGIDFYKEIIDYIKTSYPDKIVVNKLQTNGMLIDDNWIKFFKSNGFKIGISIDGPESIHDKHRKTINNKGTFTQVYENSNELIKNNIKPGFMAVISNYSVKYPDEIFNFFYNNRWSFGINYLSPVNHDMHDIAPTVQEYVNFYLDITKLYLSQSKRVISVNPIEHHIKSLLRGAAQGYCVNSPSCAADYLSFSPEGNAHNCNRFTDFAETSYGNINQISFSQILDSNKRKEYINRNKYFPKCNNCKYQKVCNAGCPFEDYSINNSFFSNKHECKIHSRIFSKLSTVLEKML